MSCGGEGDCAFDDVFGNDVFGGLGFFGQLIHQINHQFFGKRAKRTGAGGVLEGLFGEGVQGIVGELQFGVFHFEEFLILLDEGVFGLGEDIDKGVLIERRQGP